MSYCSKHDRPINKIVEVYKPLQEKYANFSLSIKKIIESLLKKHNISTLVVTSRSKGLENLRKKLKKIEKGKKDCYYTEKPIKKIGDIKDLAGARIIFYVPKLIKDFEEILYREGNLKIERQKVSKDSGYKAVHLYVKLKKDRLSLSEYENYNNLQCEIQLTTALDHGWSEVERILYKPSESAELNDPINKTLTDILKKVKKDYIDEANLKINFVHNLNEDKINALNFFNSESLIKISDNKSNNEVYNLLERFEKMVEKFGEVVPKTFNIVFFEKIIERADKNIYKDEKSLVGIFPGKKTSDIIVKVLDIMKLLHYLNNNFLEIFNFACKIYVNQDEIFKLKITDFIKKIVKYNWRFLDKHGIVVQEKIIEEINNWDYQKTTELMDIILNVCEEIFEVDVSGLEYTEVDSLKLRQGVLIPSENLKKIRRLVIDKLLLLAKNTEGFKSKLKILRTLQHAMRLPDNIINEVDYKKINAMIFDDTAYLVNRYREVLFKNNKLISNFPITQEIESQFLFFELNKNNFKDILPEVWELLSLLRKDREYKIYRIFINEHYDSSPHINNGKSSKDVHNDRQKEILELAKSINNKNIKVWLLRLKKISEALPFIGEWKTANLRQFFFNVGRYGSFDMVATVFEEVVQNTSLLRKYVFEILWGLRYDKYRLSLWKKYSKIIIKSHQDMLSAVFCSMHVVKDKILESDVLLLKNVVLSRGNFLKLNFKNKNDRELRLGVFMCLLKLLSFDIKNACNLIKIEISNHTHYLHEYLEKLQFTLYDKKEEDLKSISKFLRNFIFLKITEVNKMDYNEELLLLKLSTDDLPSIINVFEKRIKKASQNREKEEENRLDNKYISFPFNLTHELCQFISSHKDYKETLIYLIEKIYRSRKKYSYYYETARFLNFFSSEKNEEIVIHFINKGNLQIALSLIHRFTGEPNFKICVEFVKKANLKKHKTLLSELYWIMGETGTVSGWDGMAKAYEDKADRLAKISEENKNKKVKNFFKELSDNFKERAKEEWQEAEEERKMRKIEFDAR